jgi:hypothetical protein
MGDLSVLEAGNEPKNIYLRRFTHYPGRVESSSTPSLWLCCRAIEIELQIGSTACVRMAGQIERIPRDDRPERPQSHASMNRLQTFAAVSIAVGVAVLGLKYTLPMF